MTFSQTQFLSELTDVHSGREIPSSTRAYFQQRLRNRLFNFLTEKFDASKKKGLNQAMLARRIGRTPEVINRWLGIPSNLTIDSVSDLLLGLSSEELELGSFSPITQKKHNYSHFEDLLSSAKAPVQTSAGTQAPLLVKGSGSADVRVLESLS